jgi:membrane protein YdbS with pleckstrin-like domain
MERENVVTGLTDLIHSHLTLAIAVGVAVAVFAFLRPKQMFKLAVAAAIVVALVYVISFAANLTSTGVDDTRKFTDRPHVDIR